MKNLVMQIPFMGFYESCHAMLFDGAEESFAEWTLEESEELQALGVKAWEIADYRCLVTDYSAAHRAYAESFVKYMGQKLEEETGESIPWTFESVRSPREYNFQTDRLFVTIPESFARKMRHDVSDSELAGMIRQNHTSRDGFASYYSNDFIDWKDKAPESYDHNELMTLFQAWLVSRGITPEEYDTLELDSSLDMNESARAALDDATDWAAYESRLEALKESKKEDSDHEANT